MVRNLSKQTGDSSDSAAPSVAWLFAQCILGKPIPDPAAAARCARADREQLEWLAQISTTHAEQLRRLQGAEGEARHQRELLEWPAQISTEHAAELRRLKVEEYEAQEAQQRWEQYYQEYSANVTEWNEVDHPRQPKGTPDGGQWVGTGGGGTGRTAATGTPISTASYSGDDTNGTSNNDKLNESDVRNYFSLLYGDNGQKLLRAFEKSGGRLNIENPWLGKSALDTRNHWRPQQIRLHKDLSPVEAAQELMERLIDASGLTEVRQHLDHTGFPNIETLITSYKQSVKQAAATVALASELYLSGISIVSEGADWVITIHDLSEGNYYAAIGLLPLLPASVGKTGVILKHGRQSLRISAEAARGVKALPVKELIELLESTRKLARNMVKAGIDRPASTAAHHIVPATLEKFTSAAKAREILSKFGISVENAANGVYLPSKFDDAVKAAYHGSIHSRRYCEELYARLRTARSKEEALLALNQIRKELLTGRFPH